MMAERAMPYVMHVGMRRWCREVIGMATFCVEKVHFLNWLCVMCFLSGKMK
jgi:hypothetical protein